MKGLLTLSDNILCKKEVLGKYYKSTIAGLEVEIHFPQYPAADEVSTSISNNFLLPPEIGTTWTRGDEYLRWGYPMNQPAGDSCVELLALSIECEKEEINGFADKLYKFIETWEHAFIDYLMLETKQNTERDKNISRKTCNLELLDEKYIPCNRAINVYLTIPKKECFASEQNIINAVAFADSGKELSLEYQMLLSAYDARRTNQNRRAILDACAAMEITIVDQINQYCQSIGMLPEVLINKYRYLGERIELLKIIGISIPNEDYKTLVVDPRNSVMHNKNVFPTDNTIEKLINCVEVFLGHFHTAFY